MILSAAQITQELNHNIIIRPFNSAQLNPNSYNLKLHHQLLVYTSNSLDMKTEHATTRVSIPQRGYLLKPHTLYLGRTVEYTESHNLVPLLEGRSSVGRLGLSIHTTAGFGDVGFCGYWTLELHCVQPIRIYAGVEICQIFYHTTKKASRNYQGGKYQHNTDIQSSKLYTEFSDTT